MPLTLASAAPLVEVRRRFTLIVRSHGRWPYLERCLSSLPLDLFDRRILSMDGPDTGPFGAYFTHSYATGQRSGLSANLRQAWGALIEADEFVFDVEEDFYILDAPLDQMAAVLEANRDVAQIALVRQAWSAEEHAAGGLLHGPHLQSDLTDEGGWMRQNRIFTLNPYLAHASLLRSLSPSVEANLTAQLTARSYTFGYWGSILDDPRCIHLGAEGGMGSRGWLP